MKRPDKAKSTHPANEPLYTIENKAGSSASSISESVD